jgi:redox-sensitive bicupin YhaK (pirin superfamily)
MKKLQTSSIVKTMEAGNNEFSARKIRSKNFEGLMDPIIGFDHFKLTNDVFGAHPHAGMSAISYLFDDSVVYHNLDSIGTNRLIMPGSMMWTWAGSGVVHTEFPVPAGGRVHGLQLFVNIAAHNKQHGPQSVYVDREQIPEIAGDGVRVKVVSGSTADVSSTVATPEQLDFLDVFLSSGKSFQHVLRPGWTATIYVISGGLDLQTRPSNSKLVAGDVIAIGLSSEKETLTFNAAADSQFILLSGQPLNEEIYSSGAMAMSSPAELGKAISDFEEGKMGFITLEENELKVILPV